jgi:hypothetical protein
MILGVQGTSSFDDYKVFLRSMGVALSILKDDDDFVYIYTAGPANINSMVSEFVNLSERGMKSRGKKIKMYKVAPDWIKENINSFNYFICLSKPNEQKPKLLAEAQLNNIEVGIFNY